MLRILTDAEAEAIEAGVDPAVAAQADADLAAITAFHQSPKVLIWYALMRKDVFPKMTSVTKLAVQLQTAKLVEKVEKQDDVPVSYQKEGQVLKDRIWQACLDNDTAFLRNLLDAAYFIANCEPQPFSTTGTALLAYRKLWLELGTCPTPDLVKKRVEKKLGRTISKSQWYETLREIRQLF